jgi:hypothetical protein
MPAFRVAPVFRAVRASSARTGHPPTREDEEADLATNISGQCGAGHIGRGLGKVHTLGEVRAGEARAGQGAYAGEARAGGRTLAGPLL